ncbi:MAG: hypothetical protein ACQEQS_03880 [Thermodesulfobacteriota bacterium]
MSCLSDFKVVAIMGDKSEDMINDSISEKKSSFIKRIFQKISKNITRKFSKFFLGDLL